MDESTLVALEHENFIAYVSGAISCGRNALVTHDDGIVTMLSGVGMRLFNQVQVEGDDADPAAIVRGVRQARARGDMFVVNLRAGTDDRFSETARSAGLSTSGDGYTPAMVWYPITKAGLQSRPAVDFEIRQVTDAVGVANHMTTATDGFGVPPSIMPGIMCVDLARRDGWTVYVGYQAGKPVCTGLGLRTGRTIGVYNISTLPSARGNGYGRAITARVVADGMRSGCDVAILQATEMGRPIYERMGFRLITRYIGWIDPEPLPARVVHATGG